MARYRYAGPNPHEDAELGLIRPNDEREFEEEPSFGPWDLLDEPEAEKPAEAPATPPPAVPSLTAPPAKEF